MQGYLYLLLIFLVDLTKAKPVGVIGSLSSTTVLLPLLASVILTVVFVSLCVGCKKKPNTVSPDMIKDRNMKRMSIISGTLSTTSEDLTPVNTTNLKIDTKSKTITRKISQTERIRVKQPDTIFE